MSRDVTIVIATRNRWDRLAATLERLRRLPEACQIVVVDNASSDGTRRHVRENFPDVRLIRLRRNAGAYARTIGAS